MFAPVRVEAQTAGRGQKHFDQMVERVAIDVAASQLVLSTGYF